MPDVEVSRFVPATLPEIQHQLTPELLIDYEGTFSISDVTETDTGVRVTARATGMEVPFRFEERENGYFYEQETDDVGPFREMKTWLTLEPENEGVRVTMQSSVQLRLPLPFADRIAAWKRRGELSRAIDRLAGDLA